MIQRVSCFQILPPNPKETLITAVLQAYPVSRFSVALLDRIALRIGVGLAGILGGRMESAEVGSVPSRVGPISSRLGVWGSVVISPSGVRGRAPAENGFWRISTATERSSLYLYDKNLRGTICISVPLLQILGELVPRVPRDLRPWLRSRRSTVE